MCSGNSSTVLVSILIKINMRAVLLVLFLAAINVKCQCMVSPDTNRGGGAAGTTPTNTDRRSIINTREADAAADDDDEAREAEARAERQMRSDEEQKRIAMGHLIDRAWMKDMKYYFVLIGALCGSLLVMNEQVLALIERYITGGNARQEHCESRTVNGEEEDAKKKEGGGKGKEVKNKSEKKDATVRRDD